jgi:hypothetical protein
MQYISFINKNYITMLQRSRLIVQYTVIALTNKINAAKSLRAGEIMVLVLLFFAVVFVGCV